MGCSRAVTVVACICCLVGCAGVGSLEPALARAEAAIASGDWDGAIEVLLETEGLDETLSAMVDRLVAKGIVLTIPTENELVEWLEDRDRRDLLRAVLAMSTVDIPAGWVSIGTTHGRPDEQPVHDVWISRYRIDRHEVTNLEFAPFAHSVGRRPFHWNGPEPPIGVARHPVLGISWADAAAFCAWSGGRLPTEAEWERACAGSNGSTYPWGERWDDSRVRIALVPLEDPDDARQWLVPEAAGVPAPQAVGTPAAGATPEGVCNMGDNASEWVADWYASDAYQRLPAFDPIATAPEWGHVVRGGAWIFRSSDVDAAQEMSRCTSRNSSHAIADVRMGFRCVYEP